MKAVVIIFANTEWLAAKEALLPSALRASPCGETFEHTFDGQPVTLLHAGWGKAASPGPCSTRSTTTSPTWSSTSARAAASKA